MAACWLHPIHRTRLLSSSLPPAPPPTLSRIATSELWLLPRWLTSSKAHGRWRLSTPLRRELVMGTEEMMSQKAHGTSSVPTQKDLLWGCDVKTADKICNYNRHYAVQRLLGARDDLSEGRVGGVGRVDHVLRLQHWHAPFLWPARPLMVELCQTVAGARLCALLAPALILAVTLIQLYSWLYMYWP